MGFVGFCEGFWNQRHPNGAQNKWRGHLQSICSPKEEVWESRGSVGTEADLWPLKSNFTCLKGDNNSVCLNIHNGPWCIESAS